MLRVKDRNQELSQNNVLMKDYFDDLNGTFSFESVDLLQALTHCLAKALACQIQLLLPLCGPSVQASASGQTTTGVISAIVDYSYPPRAYQPPGIAEIPQC